MKTDITLTVAEEPSVGITIGDEPSVTLALNEDSGTIIPYTGDYDVTPKFSKTTLATKDKTMADDVTVRAIPVSRTTNPSGGKTIYIGEI